MYAWREMEAHHEYQKNFIIKTKPNGKKFSVIKSLAFKKPKDISAQQIKIVFNSEDKEWLMKNAK